MSNENECPECRRAIPNGYPLCKCARKLIEDKNKLVAETCASCRFMRQGEQVGGYAPYQCRRNPPVALLDGQWFGSGLWPAVELYDWCGFYGEKNNSGEQDR